jgi:hypothetical protein
MAKPKVETAVEGPNINEKMALKLLPSLREKVASVLLLHCCYTAAANLSARESGVGTHTTLRSMRTMMTLYYTYVMLH